MRGAINLGVWVLGYAFCLGAWAQNSSLVDKVEATVQSVEEDVIAWRRDIHEHPELSNREFRTSKLVADHLRSLDMEVRTGIAHTGVVGILKGGKPGPVVALRADMDGLPVVEQTGLPFASKEKAVYNDQDVGVMHACGHDAHVAILMGTAKLLAGMREELPGTVVFIFQPAEEGTPEGEEGGAELMIAEGVLKSPAPEVIFGLHVTQGFAVGQAAFRTSGAMASSDFLRIVVKGRQTHAAQPWAGVDPIVVGAQIVTGLQTVVSRRVDITQAPAIVSIGTFKGGVRNNIIPDEVEMTGTIRAFVPEVREQIHALIKTTAENIAESQGAVAEVTIDHGYPVTFNDPDLGGLMRPSLQRVFGDTGVLPAPMVTGAEDFSYFQEKIPGLFFFLGVRPADKPFSMSIPNHSPMFDTDEAALIKGVRAMATLTVDYMSKL